MTEFAIGRKKTNDGPEIGIYRNIDYGVSAKTEADLMTSCTGRHLV